MENTCNWTTYLKRIYAFAWLFLLTLVPLFCAVFFIPIPYFPSPVSGVNYLLIQTPAWKLQKRVAAAEWVQGLLQPSGRQRSASLPPSWT